jgi:hypothetical protein
VPYLELEVVESSTAGAWPPTTRSEVEEGGGYPIWSWRWSREPPSRELAPHHACCRQHQTIGVTGEGRDGKDGRSEREDWRSVEEL